MNHNEYLRDQVEHPDRKYLLTEGPDNSTLYIPIDPVVRSPYWTDRVGPMIERNRKARAQVRKKVSKHETPYTYRLGYHCCTGQYTGGDQVASLSGSSMNRKMPATKSPTKKPAGDCQHVMSKRSKGKIRDKATAFWRSLKKDRILVTLTFIQHVDDKTGSKILNKFLTVVRKEIPGFLFLRVAEHQQERETKTIHFHLLSNRRLTIRRYNALWVLQQYNAGLIGRRANGEEIPKSEITARYKDGTIQEVLNPMDVTPAYSISGLSWYLTKYVTKQETGESFGCLTWHCSRRVSKLFTNQVVGSSTFRYMHTFRNWKVDRRTGECWQPQTIKGNFFSLVFINNKPAVLDRLKMLECVNGWIIEKRLPDKMSRDDLISMDWEFYRRHFEGRADVDCIKEICNQNKFYVQSTTTADTCPR